MEEPVLLTPKEAGRVLRLGKNKTYELIARGRIPVIRFGRAIRIPRAALEEWIRQQAMPGGAK
jgi:excisionase family DNA binding protein